MAPPSFSQTDTSQTNAAPPQLAQASSSFSDINGNIYQAEILRAASLGFIAGPGDGTFRPNNTVTREQAVSIILAAMGVDDNQLIGIPNPFRDVPSTRWSTGKIAYAAQNNIVAGRGPGVFDPTATVTRAELMAMLKNVADQSFSGRTIGTPIAFADTAGHWANDPITYMSSYCGVATPLNERGASFAPNIGATRAFTAAAIVRLHDCSATPATPTTPTTTTPTTPTTTTLVSSFGDFSLAPGFIPDPATGAGTSGGNDAVPSACGFGGDINLSGTPDHVLTVVRPFSFLRINGTSTEDISLVIRDEQTGNFSCDDDSNGLNPEISGPMAAGTYSIWLGDFDPSAGFPYQVSITEFP